MTIDQIIGTGGIWAVFCYVLIKEVLPLMKNGRDAKNDSDCKSAHAVINEKISAANDLQCMESERIRDTLEKLTEVFSGLRDEIRELRTDIISVLRDKKG